MQCVGQDNSSTHAFIAYSANGQPWNGAAYEPWNDTHIATYLITATRLGTTNVYFAVSPTGTAYFELWLWTGTLATSYVVYDETIQLDLVTATVTSIQSGLASQSSINTLQTTANSINATVSSLPSAAQNASAVWRDTVAGDFTVNNSVGKGLYTGGYAPGDTLGGLTKNNAVISASALIVSGSTSLNGITTGAIAGTLSRVTLTDAVTTYTGNTPQTGDAYAYLVANLGALGANATAIAVSIWGYVSRTLTSVIDSSGVTTLISRLGVPVHGTISADIADIVSGSIGAFSMTINVLDSISGDPVVGAEVTIVGASPLTTDVSGNVVVGLNSGTYTIFLNGNGYLIPSPFTEVVNGSGHWVATGTSTLDLTMVAVVIPAPQSGYVTATGYVIGNEALYYKLVVPPDGDGFAYTGATQTAVTGEGGLITLELLANSSYMFWLGRGQKVSLTTTSASPVAIPLTLSAPTANQ